MKQINNPTNQQKIQLLVLIFTAECDSGVVCIIADIGSNVVMVTMYN
jgi:hypothetical protein